MPQHPQFLLVVLVALFIDGKMLLEGVVPIQQVVDVVVVVGLEQFCAAGFVEGAVADGLLVELRLGFLAAPERHSVVSVDLAIEFQILDLDLLYVFLVEYFLVSEQVEHAFVRLAVGWLLELLQPLGRFPVKPFAEIGIFLRRYHFWLEALGEPPQFLLHGYLLASPETASFDVFCYLFEWHDRRVLVVLGVVDRAEVVEEQKFTEFLVGQVLCRPAPDELGQGLDFELAFGRFLCQLLLQHLLLCQLLVPFEETSVWFFEISQEAQRGEGF